MASRVFPSESEALEAIIHRMIGAACFCLPGAIEEFDAGTQIAKVCPAVKAKAIRDCEQGCEVEYVKMPCLWNVPVVVPFAQADGLLLTLPLKKGDEGLILFADRMIDNFVEKGGCQPPECCGADNKTTEPRAHSLTDAIFIPGVISKPQAVPDWNMNAMEIRNRPRTCFISLGTDGNIEMETTADVNIKAGGNINLNESVPDSRPLPTSGE